MLAVALPATTEPISPVMLQPPLQGIVTLIEPHGQFYINIGSSDQLYSGALLQITRDGVVIGQAKVIKVGRLDAIGQLQPGYQGLRLLTGDYATVTANPIPSTPPKHLPYMEPNLSQRDAETLVALLALFGLGSALVR